MQCNVVNKRYSPAAKPNASSRRQKKVVSATVSPCCLKHGFARFRNPRRSNRMTLIMTAKSLDRTNSRRDVVALGGVGMQGAFGANGSTQPTALGLIAKLIPHFTLSINGASSILSCLCPSIFNTLCTSVKTRKSNATKRIVKRDDPTPKLLTAPSKEVKATR